MGSSSGAGQRRIILGKRLVEFDAAKCCNGPGDRALEGAPGQELDGDGVSRFEPERGVEFDAPTRDAADVHALYATMRMQNGVLRRA